MSWRVLGASVIGSSHTVSGAPCQDSHGFQSFSDDVLLLSVADGLGTAAKSEIGSRLAVDSALAAISAALSSTLTASPTPDDARRVLEAGFQTARAKLEERAAADEMALRDLGATLILAILTPEWTACAQIGDGAVVALLPDDTQRTLSTPQRGEYANETVPLTTARALEMVRYSQHEIQAKALALISDGLQNLALKNPGYEPFAPFFQPFFNAVLADAFDAAQTQIKLEAFLASERLLSRTDDDKTFVLAGKAPAAAGQPAANAQPA